MPGASSTTSNAEITGRGARPAGGGDSFLDLGVAIRQAN